MLKFWASEMRDISGEGKFLTIKAVCENGNTPISYAQKAKWRKLPGIHKLTARDEFEGWCVLFQIRDDLSDADLQKYFGTKDKKKLPEAAVQKLNKNVL
jgi:hypothetical protein